MNSLWLHQDWFIWPFLGVVRTTELCSCVVNDLSEDEQLAYTAAFARNREHELVMGLPLGVHFKCSSHSPQRPWPCSPSGKHGQPSWNAGPKPATVAIAVTAIVAVEEAIVTAGRRSRGADDKNSGRSTERLTKMVLPFALQGGGDTSDRPRRRRRRGGRGRGGSGGGNSQSPEGRRMIS